MKMKKLGNKKEDAGDDDDTRDTAKHVGGGDVRGGEGGDYVIGGDRAAVVYGVKMVPFHMNMPALIGWEKGGGRKFMEKVVQAMEPWLGRKAKNPVPVLLTKLILLLAKYLVLAKKEAIVGTEDPPSLSPGGIPLPDNPNVQQFFLALLQMMILQMSLGASQNISVAAATEREEKLMMMKRKRSKLLKRSKLSICA